MKSAVIRYSPLILLAVLWEVLARVSRGAFTLPSLVDVSVAWFDLVKSGELLTNGADSIYRAFVGLALAVIIGTLLGVFMALSRAANILISPLVEIFYPLPKSALIPITVIWLGFGDASKIVLIFLGCMLPVTIGAYNGARSTEQFLLWSASSMGAGRLRMMRDVVLPSAMPELLNGIRTALALSFILLVTSELIASRKGFGYLIGLYGSGGIYDAMFATVLTVALLGFFADRGFQMVTQRAMSWRD
jgi:ABC-type nitrate/sulfonate/bicarbonate transport system permease component